MKFVGTILIDGKPEMVTLHFHHWVIRVCRLWRKNLGGMTLGHHVLLHGKTQSDVARLLVAHEFVHVEQAVRRGSTLHFLWWYLFNVKGSEKEASARASAVARSVDPTIQARAVLAMFP